ncbi:23S rRNA (uracil(1939)-C(5))-methyltransferase RlmD [Limnochorda pilosa]|uniref:SAM-dependent methlyltransferase n=1 Tax=Limnochorda pilosa TaxID=1555112 RepID=A0A0K2SI07_LIMPI|nr:23S rRNA (uracil(1939)-C(5))-methyltransferase RlmD [Limnochorda pilosa]BAS26647.1 SAM-dependent methlyltransferase [Limnochorda pilosa]
MPDQAAEQVMDLRIEGLDAEGVGLASRGADRVRIPGALPGERVEAIPARRHRHRVEGRLLRVLEPAPERVAAPCPHYGECGGCSLQHLDYPAQLAFKRRRVKEALARAGVTVDVPSVIGMEEPWGYRNKVDLSFGHDPSRGVRLGFHRRGRWHEVVPAAGCLIAPPELLAAVRAVEGWALAHGLDAYDPRTHTGFLRTLLLREGRATGQRMVALVTAGAEALPGAGALREAVARVVPGLRSLLWVVNEAPSDALKVDRVQVLWGEEAIEEELGGLRYPVAVESFFQTNTLQARRLLATVLELAKAAPTDGVLDLFCGVGTFALALSPRVRNVVGIEWVEEAVQSARRLAEAAGFSNARFLAGPVRLLLPEAAAGLGGVDLVLLDPPRSGAGGKVMRKIGRAAPRRVVYVSCNPQTLGEDLVHLLPFGYRVNQVRALDLFPHTPHVETVVRLERTGR